MSKQFFESDVLFAQRLFSAAGLYHGELDSRWGKQTTAAETAWESFYVETAKAIGAFDARTEGNIFTLLPKAQVAARRFMLASRGTPFVVKILSGTRTYAEQDALFAKRPKVTNARGGQSNHNFGIAWDVGIFVNGDYYEGGNAKEEKAYDLLAKIELAAQKGIEWGGNWKSIVDKPHYQLATGKTVTQCRQLLEQGKPYA